MDTEVKAGGPFATQTGQRSGKLTADMLSVIVLDAVKFSEYF